MSCSDIHTSICWNTSGNQLRDAVATRLLSDPDQLMKICMTTTPF